PSAFSFNTPSFDAKAESRLLIAESSFYHGCHVEHAPFPQLAAHSDLVAIEPLNAVESSGPKRSVDFLGRITALLKLRLRPAPLSLDLPEHGNPAPRQSGPKIEARPGNGQHMIVPHQCE